MDHAEMEMRYSIKAIRPVLFHVVIVNVMYFKNDIVIIFMFCM